MRRNPLLMLAVTGLVGAVTGSLLPLSASAAPVTSFTSQPVTDANAIADDPALANRILNLMKVDVGGNDWTNAVIRVQLSTGTVYNATNLFAGAVPVGTDASPNPALWSLAGARNGKYDTFVNMKGQTPPPDDNPRPAFLGGGALPGETAQGLNNANATLVSVNWGVTLNDLQDPNIDRKGLFSIARFTLSSDATGTFTGLNFDSTSNGVGTPFTGVVTNGVMTLVPEPTAFAVVGFAAAALLRRRRCS